MSRKRQKYQDRKRIKYVELPAVEPICLPQEQYRDVPPIQGITENGKRYLTSLKNNRITFGIGPAGTGKSYTAVGYACDLLKAKKIKKIIITRPMVECDEELGILPGEEQEKYAPYFQPIKDILYERLGRSSADYYIEHGIIQARPLGMMRGTTFKDTHVVLDEGQNTTIGQMKMFLSRVGIGSKLFINGDIEQIDITKPSGLVDALKKLNGIPEIGVVEFDEDDIVRDTLVKAIIKAYRKKPISVVTDRWVLGPED